jgi:hypothetical protein
MAIEISELDALQQKYKDAVDEWVAAIRHEEELASPADHSEADLDQWEEAAQDQQEKAKQVAEAKKAYEGALREEFFDF